VKCNPLGSVCIVADESVAEDVSDGFFYILLVPDQGERGTDFAWGKGVGNFEFLGGRKNCQFVIYFCGWNIRVKLTHLFGERE
jgi:hypothetical protein